jgi:hypothetical protein
MLSAVDLGRPLRNRIADGGNPRCQGQVSTRCGRSLASTARAAHAPKPSFFSPGRGRPLSVGKLSFISRLCLSEVCQKLLLAQLELNAQHRPLASTRLLF